MQAANFQFSSLQYTLVYQRNHGLLPHSSNTLLHGTNSPEAHHFGIGSAGPPADAAMTLAGAVLARAAVRPKSVAPEIHGNGRAPVAGGHRMLFACRLMELEATPGIEPGYTVLQTVA